MELPSQLLERRGREPEEERTFRLLTVTAERGGRYSKRDEGVTFTTKRSANEACEALQRDWDQDCEPRRTYVTDEDGVPVYAAVGR